MLGEDVAHDTGQPGPRRTAVGMVGGRGPDHAQEHVGGQVGDVAVIGDPAREVEPHKRQMVPVELLELRRVGGEDGDAGLLRYQPNAS